MALAIWARSSTTPGTSFSVSSIAPTSADRQRVREPAVASDFRVLAGTVLDHLERGGLRNCDRGRSQVRILPSACLDEGHVTGSIGEQEPGPHQHCATGSYDRVRWTAPA